MKRVLLLTTRTLPTSLLLAALGVALFDGVHWGLNLPVFALACCLAVLSSLRVRTKAFGVENVLVGVLSVAWSLAFVLRDSTVLHSLAGIALTATLYLVYLRREFASLSMPVSALFTRLPLVVRTFLRGPLCAIRQELAGTDASRSRNTDHTFAVARGFLLSVPLLVVFGWLLISADARFAEFAWDLLELDFSSLLRTVVTFTLCFWIVVFLLRARMVYVGTRPSPPVISLQPLEVTTALIVLDALLVLYMAVQLTYFIGGDALIRATQSLTYAQYARRGFFELVAVAALTVPLLLGADWLCETARGRVCTAQQWASVATIALVVLIGCSAAHRLLLYAEAYGLTEQRFYAAAALLWAAVLLVWIAWTVLRGRRDRFLGGAFVTALSIIALLMLVNPHARIAQYNTARAAPGQSLDVDYLLSLGADAVPALLASRAKLPREYRMVVENALLWRAMAYNPPPWQGWNWARYTARRAVFGWPAFVHPADPRDAAKP